MLTLDDTRALILGHAVGDALGVPVEFQTREELRQSSVTDMRGYGSYDVPAGAWSDDTSMTLALMESLARMGCVDYVDIMKNFLRWADDAEFTPTGFVFDMGHATMQALMKFANGTAPLDCGGKSEYDNGNGSLMRIAPLVLYLFQKNSQKICSEEVLNVLHQGSSLTHSHPVSKMACGIYGLLVAEVISKRDLKSAIRSALHEAHAIYENTLDFSKFLNVYHRLWDMDAFAKLEEADIKSSGYVVDTLEAVIWCLLQTSGYRECVLLAVNLGEDTDTVAAIAGGVAGLAYGLDSISSEWMAQLKRYEYIEEMCKMFYCTISKEVR